MPLPSGTITFLFTDIEGSTKLWKQYPAAMPTCLVEHEILLRRAIEANNGAVFKTVGDGLCAAFDTPRDALKAALSAQTALCTHAWGEIDALRVRMGVHTGTAQERDNDYFGPNLSRVARLVALACGGQILLSQATYELVRDGLPDGMNLKFLGAHRLKDLQHPEHAYQLLHPDLPSDFPPLQSLDALPNNLPQQMTSFIGREQQAARSRTMAAPNAPADAYRQRRNGQDPAFPASRGRSPGTILGWRVAGGTGFPIRPDAHSTSRCRRAESTRGGRTLPSCHADGNA